MGQAILQSVHPGHMVSLQSQKEEIMKLKLFLVHDPMYDLGVEVRRILFQIIYLWSALFLECIEKACDTMLQFYFFIRSSCVVLSLGWIDLNGGSVQKQSLFSAQEITFFLRLEFHMLRQFPTLHTMTTLHKKVHLSTVKE